MTDVTLKPMDARAFAHERGGVASVEGAIGIALLSMSFLAVSDIGAKTMTQAKLASALRFSGQYIANGGTDIGTAEAIFRDGYGSIVRSFSSKVKCSCAGSQSSNDPQTNEPKAVEQIIDGAVFADGGWSECSLTCGTAPLVKYVMMDGEVAVTPFLGDGEKVIQEAIAVRVE